MNRKNIGAYGERLVAQILEQRGHKVLARNWRTRWLEVDLITRFKQEVWVVEVKTRRTGRFGLPEEAVTRGKMLKLKKAAEAVTTQAEFLNLGNGTVRCVVAAVLLEPRLQIKFINLEAY